MNRGFTIVELIITLSVIMILLTLGVVSFQSTQTQSRDSERLNDAETIARGLERRYAEGNPVASSATTDELKPGRYPTITEIQHALGTTVAAYTPSSSQNYLSRLLPGTNAATLQPPTASGSFAVICSGASCTGKTPGAATALDPHFGPSVSPTRDKYVYEPIASDGTFCSATVECVRFNLYWYSESESVVKKIESKKQ